MTSSEYRTALKQLGLSFGSKETANALGVGLAACKRYASGAQIPNDVVLKIRRLEENVRGNIGV